MFGRVTEKTTFTTTDGKDFENIQDANFHQATLDLKEAWLSAFPAQHGAVSIATMKEFMDEVRYPGKNLHRALRKLFDQYPEKRT